MPLPCLLWGRRKPTLGRWELPPWSFSKSFAQDLPGSHPLTPSLGTLRPFQSIPGARGAPLGAAALTAWPGNGDREGLGDNELRHQAHKVISGGEGITGQMQTARGGHTHGLGAPLPSPGITPWPGQPCRGQCGAVQV